MSCGVPFHSICKATEIIGHKKHLMPLFEPLLFPFLPFSFPWTLMMSTNLSICPGRKASDRTARQAGGFPISFPTSLRKSSKLPLMLHGLNASTLSIMAKDADLLLAAKTCLTDRCKAELAEGGVAGCWGLPLGCGCTCNLVMDVIQRVEGARFVLCPSLTHGICRSSVQPWHEAQYSSDGVENLGPNDKSLSWLSWLFPKVLIMLLDAVDSF